MQDMKISTLILCCTMVLFMDTVSADWAYRFVVNDGKIYIITDKQVVSEQIGPRIGKVTKYSDHEGTYAGNFSNYYPKETEYYSIVATDLTEAIAVKTDEGYYIKAEYGGEYAGGRYNWNRFIPYIFAVFLAGLICYLLMKKVN